MSAKPDLRIDVWSDVICPWCWLGRARLLKALAAFDGGAQAKVVFRSFELDPKSDRELDVSTSEMLKKKLSIGQPQIDAMHERLKKLGQADGIDYHFEKARTSNTFDAHQLIHFAYARGKQSEMVDRLFVANFKEGLRIGDRSTLVKLATDVGLDAAETEAGLVAERWGVEVRADEAQAKAIGVSGVPFFLFNEKVAVAGAESVELLSQALAKAVE